MILTNNGMTFYEIPDIVWFVTEIIVLLGGCVNIEVMEFYVAWRWPGSHNMHE